MQEKRLVLTLPVHNESAIIERNVVEVLDFLSKYCPVPFLLLLAEDGSTDDTPEIMNQLKKQHGIIRVYSI